MQWTCPDNPLLIGGQSSCSWCASPRGSCNGCVAARSDSAWWPERSYPNQLHTQILKHLYCCKNDVHSHTVVKSVHCVLECLLTHSYISVIAHSSQTHVNPYQIHVNTWTYIQIHTCSWTSKCLISKKAFSKRCFPPTVLRATSYRYLVHAFFHPTPACQPAYLSETAYWRCHHHRLQGDRQLFKKRALRTAPQIIALRLVMNNLSNTFRPYPYCFPNEQAFPDENVSVGEPLLKGPRGSSGMRSSAGLPVPPFFEKGF